MVPDTHLPQLKDRYKDLEAEISRAVALSLYDQLAVQRLRRQTLKLRDRIQQIENSLIPDIVA